ncbi:MAG: PIN domain-containing protein [Nitrospirota bacterium]
MAGTAFRTRKRSRRTAVFSKCRSTFAISYRFLTLFYSIGVILTKLKKDDVFKDFLSDTIEDSGVIRICLDTTDLKQIITVRQRYQLDFDDSYQYVAAEKYKYTIVSFDSDFDRTEHGRKSPKEALS